jgi:flagellin
MRINSAADDASGYAISERMRVQIRSLDQDNRNTQNGNSMMKVAEGAVSSTVEILKTLKEKVINAANDTNTDSDRQQIQKELDQSIDQINDNANVTYNGKYLVDGSHNRRVSTTADNPPADVATHLTNESLDAKTAWSSKIYQLKNRNGESLNIQSTDMVTISVVNEGKTYTTSFKADTEMSAAFTTKLGNALRGTEKFSTSGTGLQTVATGSDIGTGSSATVVTTADLGTAMTLKASKAGVEGQISGLTISITDSNGNINKSANAVLDNFTESIRAQNHSEDNAIVLQTGTKANQAIKIGLTDMRAQALGLQGKDGSTLNVSTQKNANAAINVLDNAIQKALDQQTTIGAIESRLEYTSTNLTTASENVTASESTIRDADMAKEMTEYTKNNVLLQAAQSMLAQANQNSSSVLSLLQ